MAFKRRRVQVIVGRDCDSIFERQRRLLVQMRPAVDEEGLVAEHQTTSPKVMGLNPTGNRASVFFFYFFFPQKID